MRRLDPRQERARTQPARSTSSPCSTGSYSAHNLLGRVRCRAAELVDMGRSVVRHQSNTERELGSVRSPARGSADRHGEHVPGLRGRHELAGARRRGRICAVRPGARSNLVASGMGHAIIRLGHEANGTWAPTTPGRPRPSGREWKEFWRKTVFAMRSVPRAHFSFNWCISDGYRPIPFADYYPGNDVVNSIGVDLYDNGAPPGLPTGPRRWTYQYDRPGGVAAIAAFAKAHGKPLSIPEWGLEPAAGRRRRPRVRQRHQTPAPHLPGGFQSYFFNGGSRTELISGRAALNAYCALSLTRDPQHSTCRQDDHVGRQVG